VQRVLGDYSLVVMWGSGVRVNCCAGEERGKGNGGTTYKEAEICLRSVRLNTSKRRKENVAVMLRIEVAY
jgi:hypothetical protein